MRDKTERRSTAPIHPLLEPWQCRKRGSHELGLLLLPPQGTQQAVTARSDIATDPFQGRCFGDQFARVMGGVRRLVVAIGRGGLLSLVAPHETR